jgi:hypothetical protein
MECKQNNTKIEFNVIKINNKDEFNEKQNNNKNEFNVNNFFPCFLGDGPMFPSMLDSSLISRSDTSGESGSRGNGSASVLDQSGADRDPSQKYACARCGRSYLHQVNVLIDFRIMFSPKWLSQGILYQKKNRLLLSFG